MSTIENLRLAAEVKSDADGERGARLSSEPMTPAPAGEGLPDSRLDDYSGGLNFTRQGIELMVADWARIAAERKG